MVAVGGGEDKGVVLFYSKENRTHKKYREHQERGDSLDTLG